MTSQLTNWQLNQGRIRRPPFDANKCTLSAEHGMIVQVSREENRRLTGSHELFENADSCRQAVPARIAWNGEFERKRIDQIEHKLTIHTRVRHVLERYLVVNIKRVNRWQLYETIYDMRTWW